MYAPDGVIGVEDIPSIDDRLRRREEVMTATGEAVAENLYRNKENLKRYARFGWIAEVK